MCNGVSGQNASDKTLTHEMPLVYVFGVGVLGVRPALFVLGFWAIAFCHWCFVPRSCNDYQDLCDDMTYLCVTQHPSFYRWFTLPGLMEGLDDGTEGLSLAACRRQSGGNFLAHMVVTQDISQQI